MSGRTAYTGTTALDLEIKRGRGPKILQAQLEIPRNLSKLRWTKRKEQAKNMEPVTKRATSNPLANQRDRLYAVAFNEVTPCFVYKALCYCHGICVLL